MKKYLWIALALVALISLIACNKQKPPVLDYDKTGQNEMYTQKGLPGESYVGTPPEDAKHRGYDPSSDKGEKKEAKKEEKKKEEKKKPPKKKPEEKKPEEKKPEEKKPGEKK